MATDFPTEIAALRGTLDQILAVSQPEELEKRIAELSEQAAAPDLWDDPEAAQAVTSQLSHAQAERDKLNEIEARVDDLGALVELAQEEADDDTSPRPSPSWSRCGRRCRTWRSAPCSPASSTRARRS